MNDLTVINSAIRDPRVAGQFEEINLLKLVDYEQECRFALQQISKNDYSVRVASANQNSLKSAILNVAAIGISLNPANQHAYLVPRQDQICLDISYRGMVKLATDAGAIKHCKTELVYEADNFTWNGPLSMPTHEADPFKTDRGACKGGYCVAVLPDDSVMTEVMSIDEIKKVQSVSRARKGPWVDWWEEMAKKTITKRASKSWPQTENRDRWDKAVQVMHESEGTVFTLEEQNKYMELLDGGNSLVEFYLYQDALGHEKQEGLFSSFPKGQISAYKEKVRRMTAEGRVEFDRMCIDIDSAIEAGDMSFAQEIKEDLPEYTEKIADQLRINHQQQFIDC